MNTGFDGRGASTGARSWIGAASRAAALAVCGLALWFFNVDPLVYSPPEIERQSLRRMTTHLAFSDLGFLSSRQYRAIIRGEPLVVVFDHCPVSDEGYNPADDFLGTVKCGERYEVSYDRRARQWAATGYNEYQANVITDVTLIGDPGLRLFSVWGLPLTYDDAGRVFLLGDGSRVGTLQ